MPRMDLNTVTFGLTWDIIPIVDLRGFQSIFMHDADGSAFGMKRIAAKPAAATHTTPAEISALPSGRSIRSPPQRVPVRIAI